MGLSDLRHEAKIAEYGERPANFVYIKPPRPNGAAQDEQFVSADPRTPETSAWS
jgi:hypothetical protein